MLRHSATVGRFVYLPTEIVPTKDVGGLKRRKMLAQCRFELFGVELRLETEHRSGAKQQDVADANSRGLHGEEFVLGQNSKCIAIAGISGINRA